MGSSQTRARTRVPCIGRQILNHCATREAQDPFLLLKIEGPPSNTTVIIAADKIIYWHVLKLEGESSKRNSQVSPASKLSNNYKREGSNLMVEKSIKTHLDYKLVEGKTEF